VPPDVQISRRAPRRGSVVAPERHQRTGRKGPAFNRSDKHDASRPTHARRLPGKALVGAGAVIVSIVAIVALVTAGRDDDPSSAAPVSSVSSVSSIAPANAADGTASDDSGTAVPETIPAESDNAALTGAPDGAVIGFDAALTLTAFDEVIGFRGSQRNAVPQSPTLDVVCGPTQCLIPAFGLLDAELFESGAESVSSTHPTVTINPLDLESQCVFHGTQQVELTRHADGSYTGTIATTARKLFFRSTVTQCYDYTASWDVVMTPRLA
jgi:hypothetical protein